MKYIRNISGLIIFISIFFTYQKLLSQCPVGDTCFIGIAFVLTPDEKVCNGPFYAYSYSFEHQSGKDFFVKMPQDFCFNCVYQDSIFFAPKSGGKQTDSILLSVKWQNGSHYYCQTTTSLNLVSAVGIVRNKVTPLQQFEDLQITANNSFIFITTNFPQPQNPTLELYDVLGHQLPLPITQLQIPSGASSQKLEVGNLSSGCYILRMKMKDQVICKRFVVTR